MKFPRASGIILHPTSLPGPYGIGDLGPEAHRFVDFLSEAGCGLWQVLPLGPTGYGDSPYQSFSAFAGNPYLISPDLLLQDGFLLASDLEDNPGFSESRIDFGRLIPWKLDLLRRSFHRFLSNPDPFHTAFDAFSAANAAWLDDYSLFMALKEAHGGMAWTGWPAPLRSREAGAVGAAGADLSEDVLRFTFYQYLFFKQWNSLRAYANGRQIQIIGDAPIFVAHDSADVWSQPGLFFLDPAGNPTVVAGVPPDGFSPTGQLWGNPLYNWEVHKQTGFRWWLERVRSTLQSVDILRLDHFRGLAGYYEIPAGRTTAEIGRWVAGPGAPLFRMIVSRLGEGFTSQGAGLPIIAEDLGVITPDVVDLLNEFNLPGMKVMQFGFTGPDNPFLPHNYVPNCVAYTGTHDNDTAHGWFEKAPREEREFAKRYLGTDGTAFAWDLIRSVWASVAVLALTPMQDVLELGTEARMNYPSRLGGNWEWRLSKDYFQPELAARLRALNNMYYRSRS